MEEERAWLSRTRNDSPVICLADGGGGSTEDGGAVRGRSASFLGSQLGVAPSFIRLFLLVLAVIVQLDDFIVIIIVVVIVFVVILRIQAIDQLVPPAWLRSSSAEATYKLGGEVILERVGPERVLEISGHLDVVLTLTEPREKGDGAALSFL